MSNSVWTWAAFVKRNVKLSAICLAGGLFLWNGVVLWEWLSALFGWESHGYTVGEQRKYRFFSMVFLVLFMFGVLLDVFNTLYYRKHPEEAKKLKNNQIKRKVAKSYKAQNSSIRTSFVESTVTGDIIHRAELSQLEKGYVLCISRSGQELQVDDFVKKFESEQAVKQYLEKKTPFRWGDFATPAAIENNRLR